MTPDSAAAAPHLPPDPPPAFDDLFDVERLRRLLQIGQGQGVRVAVVDTGVEADHPAIAGCIDGCYEVVRVGGRHVCQPSAADDHIGHGTACAGIIHAHAPQARITSIRVIGQNASGTGEQFMAGLAWAIEQRFDVINLSLGTTQKRLQTGLQELVDQAYFQGAILVAAANNYQMASYPAVFGSLIAVDNQAMPSPLELRYFLGRAVEIEAQGIYVRAPTKGGGYQLWTGTSFACPHVSAVLTRAKSALPGLTPFQAKALLWCLRANK